MLPEAGAEDLLYATNGDGNVYVFSYPKTKEVGELTGLFSPQGACSDRTGNIWITLSQSSGAAVEYAHGGTTPIATLAVPGAYPPACSVGPSTGNLAVPSGNNSVSIFRNAQGTPATYVDSKMWWIDSCAYDNAGNLFLRGENWNAREELVELRKDRKTFASIRTNADLMENGAVGWDGKYLAVQALTALSDPEPIDRVRVTGHNGTVEEVIHLDQSSGYAYPFWVQGNLIAQATARAKIRIWRYPGGGSYLNRFRNRGFGTFLGVAVSKASGAR